MACDGEETLEALEREAFDVLLLDVNMPKLDGIEACKMWRQIEGPRAHLPIIGVTADATSDTEERCLNAGMDLRLTKPVNAKLLLDTIDMVCEDVGQKFALPTALQDPSQKIVSINGLHDDEGQSPIDQAHLDYLYSIGGDNFVSEMIESFMMDADEGLNGMARSADDSDIAQFRFFAHAMKSCSNNIGALHLAALCAQMESITEGDFHARKDQHLKAVQTAFEKVKPALELSAHQSQSIPAASSG
jgi:two-component system sensor histidine kinase RpfC